MTAPSPQQLAWWTDGEQHLAAVVDGLTDDDFDGATLLPDWNRQTLLAHIARNADALVNLLTWARTGVAAPMYSSPEARAADIERSATQSVPELRADVREAAQRLRVAVEELPTSAWGAEVRTAQGRPVPATEVVWMRCREVWVHPVDLAAGATFADAPQPLLTALIDDVVAAWERKGETPDLALHAAETDTTWRLGAGKPLMDASLATLAAVTTGRAPLPPGAPHFPAWL